MFNKIKKTVQNWFRVLGGTPYPISYQAVDIVVINNQEGKVLLVRRHNESKFRFAGGFVDPTDRSLEDAASREILEEAGISYHSDNFHYFKSFRVDDPRYQNKIDKIMSAVFILYTSVKDTCPKDIKEIAETYWISYSDLKENYQWDVAEEHEYIVRALIEAGKI